jgi:hypothetical protein
MQAEYAFNFIPQRARDLAIEALPGNFEDIHPEPNAP